MKHLKTKLMMSVVSLMLATIMMTSASFAWFTISTNPEISGMTATVAANGNLEIALASDKGCATEPEASTTEDAGKNITWGNLTDLSAYFSGAEFELKPVELDLEEGTVNIPSFGLDGRISGVTESEGTWTALGGDSDFGDGGIVVYEDEAGTPWAFRVDFFMRTNVDGAISLLAPEDINAELGRGAQDSTAAGTTITEGSIASVAFAVGDELPVVFYDGTADTPAWDFETPILEAEANTVYKVSMYVYYDGAGLTNATMQTEVADLELNVQFTHEEDLTPLDVQGENYDKPTTTTTGG